jgi:hypothetical protein
MVNDLTLDPPIDAAVKTVHQSLHGYSGGHRLIESSIDCPTDVARLLLRMSDLSGGNIVSGFEDYLTAYPLKQIGMYAFAKTWLAREMPRPGCVWTHTLLLSESQLGFASLEALLKYFKRPQFRKDSGTYLNPIEVSDFSVAPDTETAPVGRVEFATKMLAAYYKSSSLAVLLPAKSSKEHESLVLALWSQQWPALRSITTFSTGSLASRNFENKPFDIQCLPISAVREAQLEISSASRSDVFIVNDASIEIPDWAGEAAADLVSRHPTPFRSFLWEAGGSDCDRQDFAKFATIHHQLSEGWPSNLIDVLGKTFPDASQAGTLKKKLLGGDDFRQPSMPDDAELLTNLGTTEFSSAFDSRALRLKERGAKLADLPSQAKRLVEGLFKTTINPLGEEVLAGLISGLDANSARNLTYGHPHFLSTIVSAKPSLAMSSQLWLGAEHSEWEVFDALVKSKDLEDDIVKGAVSALLETRRDDVFRRTIDVWGRTAIFGAMDWLNQTDGDLSDSSRGALTFHTTQVMDWVEDGKPKSKHGLVAAAHILAPYSYQIKDRNTAVWGSLLKELHGYERVYLAAFLLALGLSNAPDNPIELIKENFDFIYQLARDEELDSKIWEILEPVVPEIAWPNNWDRCERMVRGLIASFVRYAWPPQQIYYCVSQNRVWDRFPKSAKKVDGGVAFMQKLT